MSAYPMRKRPQYKVAITRFEGNAPTSVDEMYDDAAYQTATNGGNDDARPSDFPFTSLDATEEQLHSLGWAKSDDGYSWKFRYVGGRGNQVAIGIIQPCGLA